MSSAASAMYNIFYYLLLSFQSGKPLKAVEADCSLYSAQMIELKRLKIAFTAKILWQTILNLIGAENTTVLTGRELDYSGMIGMVIWFVVRSTILMGANKNLSHSLVSSGLQLCSARQQCLCYCCFGVLPNVCVHLLCRPLSGC